MHILSASDSCSPQPLYIEQAQLYWQKGCQEDAFITLNRSFLNHFKPAQYYKQLSSGDCNEERKQYAKVCNTKTIIIIKKYYIILIIIYIHNFIYLCLFYRQNFFLRNIMMKLLMLIQTVVSLITKRQ